MTQLVRITSPKEWIAGRIEDEGDGFVHLSAPHQVLTPANELYHGRADLLLLVLDRTKLGRIEVEAGFPHLYDVLAADAVVETVTLPCDEDGRFRLALVPCDARERPAADLLDEMVGELRARYGPDVIENTPSARPDELWYLVGWDESGDAVCGGALKHLDDETAEIKRMFVRPHARRHGHAKRLLAGLEDAARRRGYRRVRLDTGAEQPEAMSLYRGMGYVEIDSYNANPYASFWGEKLL